MKRMKQRSRERQREKDRERREREERRENKRLVTTVRSTVSYLNNFDFIAK